MVIHKINVTRVAVVKPEDHAVVGPDRDGREPFQVPLEGVQSKTGQVHILGRSSAVEDSQNIFDLFNIIRSDALAVAVFEQPF